MEHGRLLGVRPRVSVRASYTSDRPTVSPMIVDRRCPTCISFATFGDEKSTTAFLSVSFGAQLATPPVSMAWMQAGR